VKTLVIGRSPFADIVIADPTLAPHHAELVLTGDGRLYLTDCASPGGSRRGRTGADGSTVWEPIRQDFVEPDEALRLGQHLCTAAALIKAARGDGADAGVAASGGSDRGEGGEGPRRGLRGRLERDPQTGEVVRRRP